MNRRHRFACLAWIAALLLMAGSVSVRASFAQSVMYFPCLVLP